MPTKISFKQILPILLCAFAVLTSSCQNTDLTTTVAVAEEKPTDAGTLAAPVRIAAVGDIMLGSPFPDDTRMPPNDGADILRDVTPILSAADIAFGNLEGPLADGGDSAKCRRKLPSTPTPTPAAVNASGTPEPKRCYAFRMPTRYAGHLRSAGFDVLSLANNHAADFGDDGRASTRRALDEAGIKHAGSDRTRHSTTFVEAKGKTVAFVGFAHNEIVPDVNDLALARRLVTEAEQKADIVVVTFHGGAEGIAAQNVPHGTEMFFKEKRGDLRAFSKTVIDAGADLVLGHGPHVLRGMEIYRDRLVAYSLGNFATYGWFRLQGETALTMILEADLDPSGKFVAGRVHPAKQVDWGVPVLDDSRTAIEKVRRLSLIDFGKAAPKIADDGTISLN